MQKELILNWDESKNNSWSKSENFLDSLSTEEIFWGYNNFGFSETLCDNKHNNNLNNI